jgi:integrase/recombinase XerD
VRRPRPRSALVDEYVEWLAAEGMSAQTIHQRAAFADSRLREWGTFDQDPAFLAGWLSAYDGWTRRTYQVHLRSLYRWLVEAQHLPENPVTRIRSKPTPRCRPTPLSAEELERCLDASQGRLRAWLLLGALAGLRAHEIAKVRGEDVTEQSLRVVGKGGTDCTVPLHPELWSLAQAYPRQGWWFPTHMPGPGHVTGSRVSQEIRALFRQLGIDQGAAHRLRHTYGTTLGRAGVPIRVVQELMRHASLSSTERYLGVDEDEKVAAIALLR